MSFGRKDPAPGPGPASTRRHMVEHVLAGRRTVEVAVPNTVPPLVGHLRLLTRAESGAVRDEVRAELRERGITATAPGVLEGYPEWREAMIVRVVARAVRDGAGDPLGTVEDWAELDDVALVHVWERYQDLEAELDPFGERGPPLSPQDQAAILAAAKAGGVGQLMPFGSYKLARFAITMAAERSS